MLPRQNRIVSGSDYKRVLRRGKRTTGRLSVISAVATGSGDARFGFIITRKVGNAVTRNRIRRRLKAICRELIDSGAVGQDVVIRALPASVSADWATLRHEVRGATMRSEG